MFELARCSCAQVWLVQRFFRHVELIQADMHFAVAGLMLFDDQLPNDVLEVRLRQPATVIFVKLT